MVTDSERKEYNKKYRDTHKEQVKKWKEKYRLTHKKETSIYNKRVLKVIKVKAYETISRFHNTDIKCWRCEETLIEALTIAHINQDGKEDRKIMGSGVNFYRKIISGKRSCEDLRLECFKCNMCLDNYGKYPDEIDEKDWLNCL
jgi:hypothetical protein